MLKRITPSQVDKWVKYLNHDAIKIEKLTLGLTNRSAVTELRAIAARHHNPAVVGLFSGVWHAGPAEKLAALQREAQNSSEVADMWAELQAYLETYYYMADGDEDLLCVHWAEEPGLPVAVLSGLVLKVAAEEAARAQSGEGHMPLLVRQDSAVQAHDQAMEEVIILLNLDKL